MHTPKPQPISSPIFWKTSQDRTLVQFLTELIKSSYGMCRCSRIWNITTYLDSQVGLCLYGPSFHRILRCAAGWRRRATIIADSLWSMSVVPWCFGGWIWFMETYQSWIMAGWEPLGNWYFSIPMFILFLGLELIGNAWAAAGMLRVHQTLKYSSEAEKFVDQQANLTQWINEILGASWAHQVCLIFAYVMLLLLNFECTTFHRHRMVVSVMLLTTRHPTLTQHRRPSWLRWLIAWPPFIIRQILRLQPARHFS